MAIYVGIGGWDFAPWRGTFYPTGLKKSDELAFASRQLSSIEINGTFYRTQTPASFAKWRDAVPDGFVYSVKAPRYATHRKDLASAAESIGWFLDSGVLELGDRLGPLLWQFPPTRAFDRPLLQSFVDALPAEHLGVRLRHVIETRHPSFADPDWTTMLRGAGVAQAMVESDTHILLGDITADLVYARLERNSADAEEGYDSAALDGWASRVRAWATGADVADLPLMAAPATGRARDCFIYFIGGDKVQAPKAAAAMLRRLGTQA